MECTQRLDRAIYGILQAMCTSIRAFTDPGDGIIIQPPVYLLYARAIDRCGRNLVNNPLVYKGDHWEMDFVDLEEKMSRPENKLMLLCNPHNPTMDVWGEEGFRAGGPSGSQVPRAGGRG